MDGQMARQMYGGRTDKSFPHKSSSFLMPQLLLDSLKAGSGLENSWLYSALKTVLLRSHRPVQEDSCPSAAAPGSQPGTCCTS